MVCRLSTVDLFGFIVYVIHILSWCPPLPNSASAGAKVGSWNQNLGAWRVHSLIQKDWETIHLQIFQFQNDRF